MGNVIIFAEKPDIGTRLAATLGGCYINGTELKPDMLNDKRYEGLIKKERASNGYFECNNKTQKYIVTWGYGHLAELKQAKDYDSKYKAWNEVLFPFVPEEYEIKAIDKTIKQFDIVKKLFNGKDIEYIVDATDADREGSLIFDYVYRLSGCKRPCKRLWISSYTEEAINEGFDNLKSEKEMRPIQEAGRCRSIADWLVGSNFTVLSTIKFGGYENMISIGRVQTPTLAILVERELEIRNFKSDEYFELIGTFKTQKGESYLGKWKGNKSDRFTNKKEAEVVMNKVNGKNGKIINYQATKTNEKPPLLYDLTSLQMDANSKFGFSAKETLDIAQKLYEKQLITYPRTNARYLPEDMKTSIKRIIKALPNSYNPYRDTLANASLSFTKRMFDNSKIESHYAIIPTYKVIGTLNDKEMKVYDLIARSLLKGFMEDAIWGNTKIETQVEDETFLSSGKTLITEGWRALELKNKSNDEALLPNLKKQDVVIGKKYEVLKKQTKAPNRYTEKTLLSTMETAGKFVEDEELREAMKEHGIGTPATRAAVIERLIQVNYIVRNGKTLIPTDKGIEIINVLPIEEIKSPALTGDWEYRLSQVEKGKISANDFIKDIETFTINKVNELKQYDKKEIFLDTEKLGICPNCNAPIVSNKKGWGCSNWKNGCKFQIWNSPICGKKLTKTLVKQLLSKKETGLIEGFTSKQGKAFNAKLELEKDGNGKLKFKF